MPFGTLWKGSIIAGLWMKGSERENMWKMCWSNLREHPGGARQAQNHMPCFLQKFSELKSAGELQ